MLRTLLLLGCLSTGGAVAAWPALASRADEPEGEGVERASDATPADGPVLCGLPCARHAGNPAPQAHVAAPAPQTAAAQADGIEVVTVGDEDLEFVDDPVEAGPCGLTLRFVRAGDEQSVRPRAMLWRLGAPGNRDWTWGDQCHGEGRWEGDALLFERLPAGTYRVQALGARRGSDDPPAFEVQDPGTQVRLVVPMPATHRVYLVALDPNGMRLTSGNRAWRGRSSHGVEENPAWLRRRTLRAWEDVGEGITCWSACGCGGASGGDGEPVQAGPDGFEIGAFSEPARGQSESHTVELSERGRSSIRVHVADDEPGEPGDRTYLGVSAPLALLASRVVLPDGRPALDAGARVSADCQALRVSPTTPPDAWRTLPIRVRVTLDGFEPLQFSIDLDGRMARWTMKPAAPR